MARPMIALTEDQVREVETLAALLNQSQIADYFGISQTTFKQIISRDEEVTVRYKRGKAKAIAHVANGLLQRARAGCKTSSIFYLKTQAGWRETADVPPPPEADTKDTLQAFLEEVARNSVRLGDDRSVSDLPTTEDVG